MNNTIYIDIYTNKEKKQQKNIYYSEGWKKEEGIVQKNRSLLQFLNDTNMKIYGSSVSTVVITECTFMSILVYENFHQRLVITWILYLYSMRNSLNCYFDRPLAANRLGTCVI